MRYCIFLATIFSTFACSNAEFSGGSRRTSKTKLTSENLLKKGGLNIISEPTREHNLTVGTESEKLDLNTFKEFTYEKASGGAKSNWQILEGGDKIIQRNNSNATIFYGDKVHKDFKTEGYWKTSSNEDDDYMGFVFAMKSTDEFYLFQWKRGDQKQGDCIGKNGMQVRKMSLNDNYEQCDFWGSSDTDLAKSLYQNDISWEANKEYKFQLVFHPGKFSIQISDAETDEVIESFTVKDDSYKSGKFGFYNYSQPKIEYRGFSISEIPPEVYTYQVETDANESVAVSYKLTEAPEGMTIDKDSGLISWKVDEMESSTYDVIVIAEGDNGTSAEQEYQIDLKK